MAKVLTLNAGGLSTDPSSITAGNGTMTKADNVVISRPNVIQPRPGFHKDGTSWAAGTTDYVPVTIWPKDGAAYYFVGRTGAGDFGLFAQSSKGRMTGTATPPNYAVADTSMVDARGNIYLTTTDGVRKITKEPSGVEEGTDAGFEDAGLPPVPSGTAGAGAGTTVWLADDATVAYQWCIRREDDSELTVRSAPSPWMTYTNTSGADQSVVLTIQVPLGVKADDVIEIYRSRTAAPIGSLPTTPTADLYLLDEITITSVIAANAYTYLGGISYEDTQPSQLMGRALYTSPSQQGALAANYPPPKCHQLATWSNCTWFADTITKPYVGVAISKSALLDRTASPKVFPDGSTPRLTFMKSALATGTGGNSYFIVPIETFIIPDGMLSEEYAQIVVGMGVSDTGATFTEGTKITVAETVGGTDYKFTIDNPLLGSGALSFTALFHDIVKITSSDHTEYEFWASDVETYPVADTYRRNFICTASEGETARSLARAISAGMQVPVVTPVEAEVKYLARSFEDPYRSDLYGTLMIEKYAYSGTSFTVSSTKPTVVEGMYPSNSLTSAVDYDKSRLYFSKIDQPEHVPISNWLTIGEKECRILAVTPLETQLVVWTESGVYLVSGSAPSNWRVDLLDSNIRLLSPEAHTALGGSAFGWTNIGVVRISGHRAQTISGGVVQEQLREVGALFGFGTTGSKGIFMASSPSRGLLIVGVPPGLSELKSSYLFVFSLATSAWTKWSMEARTMAYSVKEERLMVSLSDFFELRYEVTEAVERTHDGYHVVYPDSVVDGTIYLGSSSPWTPEVGDRVIITDAILGAISGSVDATASTELPVLDSFGAVVTDSITGDDVTALSGFSFAVTPAYTGTAPALVVAYETIKTELEWNVHTLGDPGTATRWREMQIQLFDTGAATLGVPYMTVGAANEESSTPSTTSLSMPTEAVASRPLRVQFPRQVHRSSHLRPYIKVTEAGWDWKLAGFGVLAYKSGKANR